MIMVDKVFCLSKGNDPRELARRDLQGHEKKKSSFSIDFVKQNQLEELWSVIAGGLLLQQRDPAFS